MKGQLFPNFSFIIAIVGVEKVNLTRLDRCLFTARVKTVRYLIKVILLRSVSSFVTKVVFMKTIGLESLSEDVLHANNLLANVV